MGWNGTPGPFPSSGHGDLRALRDTMHAKSAFNSGRTGPSASLILPDGRRFFFSVHHAWLTPRESPRLARGDQPGQNNGMKLPFRHQYAPCSSECPICREQPAEAASATSVQVRPSLWLDQRSGRRRRHDTGDRRDRRDRRGQALLLSTGLISFDRFDGILELWYDVQLRAVYGRSFSRSLDGLESNDPVEVR